jgi:hypothetical protein
MRGTAFPGKWKPAFEVEPGTMEYMPARTLIYFALIIVTFVIAYLYQRNERTQRVRGIWIWPAIFTILAAVSVVREFPKDPAIVPWLVAGFLIGIPIGVLRGVVFGVAAGVKPGEIRLRPNVVSGSIYLLVFFFNEWVHVFRHGDPNLGRFSCAFLVMTAGNSIAVNVTRLIRYRGMLGKPFAPGDPSRELHQHE